VNQLWPDQLDYDMKIAEAFRQQGRWQRRPMWNALENMERDFPTLILRGEPV